MELPKEFLHAKFDKVLTEDTETLHCKGKILFCAPYDWDETVNWDLINRLTKTVNDWVLTRVLPENIPPKSVFSTAIYSFYSCPSSWRQTSADDPKIYQKLVLYCKMVHFLYEVDDTTEIHSGNERHCKFVLHLGRMVTKILLYELQGVANLKNDELYQTIFETSPHAATYMELLIDLAGDLKTNFGVTKDLAHYCAYHLGQVFTMLTWCGDKDQSNLLNLYTQYNLRLYTGGISALIQFIFLLEGINIPRAVRDNVFWIRCLHVAGFLPVRANDIVGVEKEYRKERRLGKRADNVVFHFMDSTNCTFEQAMFRAIFEHNMALKEFHDFLKFYKNNPDILYDLNEEERKVFSTSVTIMAECVAYATQAQIIMPRYNTGFEITFEKCKTIYGFESNVESD